MSTKRDQLFAVFNLLIVYIVGIAHGYGPAVDSYALEVSFGSSHLVAGAPLELFAELSNSNEDAQAKDDLQWQLLVVSQSLDLFGFFTGPSQEHISAGDVYAVTWDNVTFPHAGQYLLAFEGIAQQNSALVKQAEGANTLLGVAGLPDTIMRPYSSSSVGVHDIFVTSIPTSMQRRIFQLSSLVVPQDSSLLDQPGAAVSMYLVNIDGPMHCTPGEMLQFTWTIKNATTGHPVTDLIPYAHSVIQLVIVSSDLDYIEHSAGGIVYRRKVSSRHGSESNNVGISSSLMDQGSASSSKAAALQASPDNSSTNSSLGARRLLQQQRGPRQLQAATSNGGFGPSIQTQVMLPVQDTYLLVGMVRRGSEVIYMPFYVRCDFEKTENEAGNFTTPAHTSAAAPQCSMFVGLQLLMALIAAFATAVLL